jgi:ubiquinone/menaquinone biosynthesis C-methylase UbiE
MSFSIQYLQQMPLRVIFAVGSVRNKPQQAPWNLQASADNKQTAQAIRYYLSQRPPFNRPALKNIGEIILGLWQRSVTSSEKTPNEYVRLFRKTLREQPDFKALSASLEGIRHSRSKKRASELMAILRSVVDVRTIKTYTDIGCGSGEITRALQGKLKNPVTHGLDLEPNTRATGFTYHPITASESYPIESESQDLVTVLMVLHHAQNPLHVIKEAYRLLKPGGTLAIREHDLEPNNHAIQLALDFIHTLYHKVFPKKQEAIHDYGVFKRQQQWNTLVQEQGFILKACRTAKKDPLKPFIAVFKKPIPSEAC